MKALLKSLSKLLLSPFHKNFYLLVILAALICLPQTIYWIGTHIQNYAWYVYVLVGSFKIGLSVLLSWCILVIYECLLKIGLLLSKFYLIAVFIIFGFSSIIDMFCLATYDMESNPLYIGVVGGTNLSETLDFLNIYITSKVIRVWIASVFLLAGCIIASIYFLKDKKLNSTLGITLIILSILAVGFYSNLHKDHAERFSPVPIKLALTSSQWTTHDIIQSNIPLIVTSDKAPSNIVIVIGESHKKDMNNLYGYKLCTNPLLSKLLADSLLICFDNISAPYTATIQCFQEFMSTYTSKDKEKYKWYETPSIPEVASKRGYHTTWISNQHKGGFHDNIISKYSKICDDATFSSDYIGESDDFYYDEVLLPIIENKTKEYDKKYKCNMYFIHLYGSHLEYAKRSPENWKKFKDKDYSEYPENQRKIRADYDNSILYTDYIISSIIKQFQDSETILIYFSDHGQDIYESSPNYFGHSIVNNDSSQTAALSIPFIIYTSPIFKENYTSIVETLKSNRRMEYNTRDVIYTIMDIIGVKFADSFAGPSLLETSE